MQVKDATRHEECHLCTSKKSTFGTSIFIAGVNAMVNWFKGTLENRGTCYVAIKARTGTSKVL